MNKSILTSILQSIKPVHCENIAAGRKTREVRKTRPKCELPVKVYIYCTIGPKLPNGFGGVSEALKQPLWRLRNGAVVNYLDVETMDVFQCKKLNGKVIGEYVCDEIIEIDFDNEYTKSYNTSDDDLQLTCLTQEQLWEYGKGKPLYLWHISDLKIYDKPKELSEFYKKCNQLHCETCKHLKWQRVNADEFEYDCEYYAGLIPLTRSPQSWCYVEEV